MTTTKLSTNLSLLLNRYPFIKSFIFLVSGSILVQGLNLLFIPVLAHLYGPSAFGIWATFIALGFIASVASFRYEIGIILAKSERISFHVFTIGMMLCVTIASIYILIIHYFSSYIGYLINLSDLKQLTLYLFLFIIGSGLYQLCIHWLIRKKAYASISFFRLLQPILIFILQIFFYYYEFKEAGLIFGSSIGIILSSLIYFSYCLYFFPPSNGFAIHFKLLRSSFFHYKGFLLYTTPYTLAGQWYKSLTTFLITIHFGLEYTGMYSIANRLVITPISLILQALSQMLLPEFSTKEKLLKSEARIRKIMILLSWIGGFCFAIGFLFIEEIISFLFGDKWVHSSNICRILMLPYSLLIFEGWIDRAYDVIKKQNVMLIQDFVFNSLGIIVFLITIHISHSFFTSLLALNIVIYIYQVIWIFLLFTYLNFDRTFLLKMLSTYYGWLLIVFSYYFLQLHN